MVTGYSAEMQLQQWSSNKYIKTNYQERYHPGREEKRSIKYLRSSFDKEGNGIWKVQATATYIEKAVGIQIMF